MFCSMKDVQLVSQQGENLGGQQSFTCSGTWGDFGAAMDAAAFHRFGERIQAVSLRNNKHHYHQLSKTNRSEVSTCHFFNSCHSLIVRYLINLSPDVYAQLGGVLLACGLLPFAAFALQMPKSSCWALATA